MRYIYFLLVAMLFISCSSNDDNSTTPNEAFLSEIRPNYFNTLNFNSAATVSEIPQNLRSFKLTYDGLAEEYENNQFKSAGDLENMRLASMYYSFFIQAVVKAYLDGMISFDDLTGGEERGLFSDALKSDSDFEDRELTVMMDTAEEIARLALNINGLNDRAYGFYLGVKQTQERLKDPNHYNKEEIQDLLIQYVQEDIQDTTFFTEWNVIMTLVFFDDYNDPVNRYDNPKMNIVLQNVTGKLNPDVLPEEDINYIALLGPVYIIDLITKKLDYMFNYQSSITEQDLEQINNFISALDNVKEIILEDRTALYNSWEFKQTIDERFQKMEELKLYTNDLNQGINRNAPQLDTFFKTKTFRQAYQCYSCHQSPD